jgi:hypothetical protein
MNDTGYRDNIFMDWEDHRDGNRNDSFMEDLTRKKEEEKEQEIIDNAINYLGEKL